jgi:hypoxanthine phosphoribosyltransferase
MIKLGLINCKKNVVFFNFNQYFYINFTLNGKLIMNRRIGLLNDIERVLITEEQIKEKIEQLGEQISNDYKGSDNFLLVGVLKGAVLFMSDLIRHIDIPLQIDFMAVSSYGFSTESSGVVRILKDLDETVEGKDLLVVEDIIDSGLTLSYMCNILKSRKPASLKICALLDKPSRRKVDLKVDYLGFEIPDHFVVGYGLDYAEKYRNLPYICVLKPEIYQDQ